MSTSLSRAQHDYAMASSIEQRAKAHMAVVRELSEAGRRYDALLQKYQVMLDTEQTPRLN